MTIASAETDFSASGSSASSEGAAAMSLSESEEESDSDNGGEEQAMAIEDRLQTLEISGIVASADGSKLYVSFEAAPGEVLTPNDATRTLRTPPTLTKW
jgi:hypothetical protein